MGYTEGNKPIMEKHTTNAAANKAIAAVFTAWRGQEAYVLSFAKGITIIYENRESIIAVPDEDGKPQPNRDATQVDLMNWAALEGFFDIAKAKASRKARDTGATVTATELKNLRLWGSFKTQVSRSWSGGVTTVTTPKPTDATKAVTKVVEKMKTKAQKKKAAEYAKVEAERLVLLYS